MVEGQAPALPPEHFLTPCSKDRGKMKATSDHDCNFDDQIIRQSANNSRGYVVPASKTEHLETFFLSEHSTNGTSLVKTLSMPPLPMPIYICSRQNPQILGPLCCLPSQSWWWPLMDGSCDVSYPDPDQNNHFKSQTSLLKRLHCWTNNVPSWSKPGTIFKKVFLTDHMIQVQ